MSNPNYTHIVLLVDASGSMEPTKQATIDGINNFIESQKRLPEEIERNLSLEDDLSDSHREIKCTATLIMFSSQSRASHDIGISRFFNSSTGTGLIMSGGNGEPSETYHYGKLYDGMDILIVPNLTSENYDTFGGTPLFDAFHRTITETSGFISRMQEAERPGRIIIVSITDGEENASTRFSREQLRQLIEAKTSQNWQFIYLGANQDAFTESSSMGVAKGQALNFVQDSAGIARGFSALTSNVLSKRSVDVQYMTAQCISDLDETNKTADVSVNTTLGNTMTNYDSTTLAANSAIGMSTPSWTDSLKQPHKITKHADFLSDMKDKINDLTKA